MTDEAVSDAAGAEHRAHAVAQARAVVGDPFQGIGFVENLQSLLGGRQRYRMRRVGAAVRNAVADLAHDVLAARQHGDRIAVGHGLGEGAQIGLDAVEFLHAAARHPEPGFHLVDEQHHAVLVAQRPRRAQIFRLRGDPQAIAHDGLDQQAGDPVRVALEYILELIRIVGLHEVREAARAQRHALAVRLHFRVAHLRPFVHGREPHGRIEQPVITALENHIVVLARVGARQAQPRHHRFGARIGEAHELCGRHHFGNALGHGELAFRGQREYAAHFHAFAGRLIDFRMSIAENRRTIAQAVVDVRIAVEIDDARSRSFFHINGALFSPVTEIGGHPQRQAFDGALKLRVALGQVSGHDSPLHSVGLDLVG